MTSWGTTATAACQAARSIWAKSVPSITIRPAWGSIDFSASLNSVDFPAPVSPIRKLMPPRPAWKDASWTPRPLP
ncbi:hypothetical protein G6F40_016982 [Rhizopus arrhizus]|nr:hypothetical protein G6F40_016982 [Rhizopus arrhizus]